MFSIDFSDRSVLITGGTKGIGLATALYFGRAGARTYLTYKWGSDDFNPLYDQFAALGAPRPVLIQADVSVDEDTDVLLAEIQKTENRIDYFISNVGFAQRTMSLDDYKKRSLFKTLEYSTWPMIEYTRRIHALFGQYPRHIVGVSSDGPSNFYQGYDFVAASKALMEHFARYLSVHLFDAGSRVNVLRFGSVKTESFEMIFGEDFFNYVRENGASEEMFLEPDECGKALFAVCSGLLDAMNGQIVSVDKGIPFQDNMMMRYLKWKEKNGKA
jgi:NAD(P)-dependent dehydrogenase (short-subunit alcohol dehydrogenase family)